MLALPIGGPIATSGVLAIVLGLALQNTLADVFAGIAFGIEAPFNVGDRISAGEKIEGTVVQMNWRSIRILTDGDDVGDCSNSVVAKSDIRPLGPTGNGTERLACGRRRRVTAYEASNPRFLASRTG